MLHRRTVLILIFVFLCAGTLNDRIQCETSFSVIRCENATLSRPFAIEETGNVHTLKIHSCDIQNNSIDGNDFRWFSSLNTLIIINSSLAYLERSSFSKLSKLNFVSIEDTEWAVLHPGQFKNNTQLHKLFLPRNKITSIPQDAFPSNLEELDLSHNRIANISRSTFDGLHSLLLLKLRGNQLTGIGSGNTFPSTLKFLHLDSNYISKIEPGVFSICVDLEELTLSFNQIRSLPEDIFRGLHNLILLRLDNNIISQFAFELLSPLDSLKFLFLHRNKIEHIQLHTLQNKSISQLHIDNYLLEEKQFPKLEIILYLHVKISEYRDIVLSSNNECAGDKCNDVLRNSIYPNEILRCPDDETYFLKIPNVFNYNNQNNPKYDSNNKLCKKESSEKNYILICFLINACMNLILFAFYVAYDRWRESHKPFSPLQNVNRPHERNYSDNEDSESENPRLIPNVDGRSESLALEHDIHAASMCQFRDSFPKLPDAVSRSDEEDNRESPLRHKVSTSTENTQREQQSNQSSVFSIPPPVMAGNLLTQSASNAPSVYSSVLPKVLRPSTVANAGKRQDDTQIIQEKINNNLIKINKNNNKETTKERNVQPLRPIVTSILQNNHSKETGPIQLRKPAQSTSYLPEHNLNPTSLTWPKGAPQLLNQSTRLQPPSTFTSDGQSQFAMEASPIQTAHSRLRPSYPCVEFQRTEINLPGRHFSESGPRGESNVQPAGGTLPKAQQKTFTKPIEIFTSTRPAAVSAAPAHSLPRNKSILVSTHSPRNNLSDDDASDGTTKYSGSSPKKVSSMISYFEEKCGLQ